MVTRELGWRAANHGHTAPYSLDGRLLACLARRRLDSGVELLERRAGARIFSDVSTR